MSDRHRSRRADVDGDTRQACPSPCGRRFMPTRSDARYCSNACRQRAYRVRRDATCFIDSCNKPRKARGLCSAHYERWRLHGDPLYVRPASRLTFVTSAGYVKRSCPGHPLADSQGYGYIHRLVVFERIGPGVHACHWCSRPVEWRRYKGESWTGVLVVDHLDGDKLNNHPANLVVSCQPCNASRRESEAA